MDDPVKRADRVAAHHTQLTEWLTKTQADIHVIAMNYQPADFIHNPRIHYHERPRMTANNARMLAFQEFYKSNYHWGIMMDNDAMLYDQPQHNSSYQLLQEMEANGFEFYSELDIFTPIVPMWSPFRKLLADQKHQDNHVFKFNNGALKGSLFFIKNFRKYGQTEIYPDLNFDHCDDNKLALDAWMAGKSLMRCENIVLKELGNASTSFGGDGQAERNKNIVEADKHIQKEYAEHGLKMKKTGFGLDKSTFLKMTYFKPRLLTVKKWMTQAEKNRVISFKQTFDDIFTKE